ncbi:reactive intermediate/imine deaminase [Vibrio sp. JPW-9-11-11]|uniref:RidA family protein n=1 Tax=Vibrio sp. JPW-9-11-11 TaxID=1416532 RepID=UPI0015948FA7|nr:RidA family protein [Vibrio sp. JPW-9-11-11]NVD08931.1 reactive intermediate/imine deaminase [Vibrio sp. JPW-9-11-11]
MSGEIIKVSRNTDSAPVCTQSTQTVAFSHYNNFSAQLPIDPKTGEIVVGDIEDQARQCLTNIKTIVESIHHVMDDVVKVTIFLKNLDHLARVDEVYASFFENLLPTRTVVEVAALPHGDALVQMDALISNGEGTYPQAPCDLVKLSRNTERAPVSKFSTQTVAFSHYNNIGAQLPINAETGAIVAGGIKAQTAQCLRNIKNIMESIDVPFDDIVKANIYVTDLAHMEAVDEVYMTFFPDSSIARTVGYMPARSVIQVSRLPLDALVQVDVSISHGDGTPPQEVEDRHGIVIRANNTDQAPICLLSTQTVAFSHYNHVTAQLPVMANSDKVVEGEAADQAIQCLTHIKAIVESIGHKMDDIVKVTIQLTDMADLAVVEKVYPAFFNHDLPARTVIGVNQIALGARVQIDAVLSNAEGTPPQR